MRTKTPLQAEKILTVAARLFATHRFHEARMEDIAAAAEVGKGTVYRYFKDKDELYRALLDRAAEQFSGRINEAVRGPGGPREQLESVVGAVISYFDEQPYLFDLIQHTEGRRSMDQDFPWARTRNEFIGMVQNLLEEGKEAGLFSARDPELVTFVLLGGLRGVIRFYPHPRTDDLPRRIVEEFCTTAAGDCPQRGARGRRRVAEPSEV